MFLHNLSLPFTAVPSCVACVKKTKMETLGTGTPPQNATAAAASTLRDDEMALAAVPPPIHRKTAAEIAPYPPMHWHSWNTFCGEDAVNEANMREMAKALISSGMVSAGYDTVNVVCNGWTGRDNVTNALQENRKLWPDGITSFSKYLHSNKMKLGCYTSPWTKNCCGEPGSLGNEAIDMETFAQMGCDHVMVSDLARTRSWPRS